MRPIKTSAILKAFIVMVLCVVMSSALIYGETKTIKLIQQHTPIVCEEVEFAKDYSFQLEADFIKESPQWEYFHGDIPYGLLVQTSGKLRGRLAGTPGEFTGKTFVFWVKAWEKEKPGTTYIFECILKIKNPTEKTPVQLEEKVYWKPTERLRLIAGYELIRSCGDVSKKNGFVDVYLSQKFPGRQHDFWKRLSIWGSIRLTSLPVQDTANFKNMSELNLNLDNIAQAGEFLIGLELYLGAVKEREHNQHYRQPLRKYTLSLILSAGALIPFNSPDETVYYYQIPLEMQVRYGGKKYFAIVPPKFNRFPHQFYAGFRLKSYDLKKGGIPAMCDIMFGMNEATSGGKNKFLQRPVIRIDGFLPLNFIKNDMIYLFGSILLNTYKKTPLPVEIGNIEKVDPLTVNILPDQVVIRNLPENNRDYYRIGIGFNLSSFFN